MRLWIDGSGHWRFGRKPDARGRGYRSGQGLRRGIQLRFRKVDGKPDARGSRHRSEQGLRRGILLGLRETAKSIAAGSELASGSDSRPCRNNAVSRSPSSNHPSSAAARPDATFLWLTLPADRKKTCGGRKWTGRPVLKRQIGTEYSCKYRRISRTRLSQCTIVSTEEYRNESGPAYRYKYRRIQKRERPSVPL